MSGQYILNEQGEPVVETDLRKWGEWFQTASNRRICLDEFGNCHVSTVFLGRDHSFGDGVPILFESMVFGGELDGEQERYATRDEAIAGHAALVERVKKSIGM